MCVCVCACMSVRVRVVGVCTRCDSCTREVQACVGAFLSSAPRLRQGAEQGADGVQGVAHPPLQVSGGGVAFMEQLWNHNEQRDTLNTANHRAGQQSYCVTAELLEGRWQNRKRAESCLVSCFVMGMFYLRKLICPNG